MGQFWVPVSAVGHKWSNFQPFRFNIGLCTLFVDISTCKTWKSNLGTYLAPFWGNDPFWGTKITRSHNYGNCASIDLKFGRFLLHNDVYNVAVCKFLISFSKWGNFGSQKVRSVLNRAIVNHFASNLDCAHDFKISPLAKEEKPIAANLCPFWGQFFSPIFFSPNFFLTKIFFDNIFSSIFFLPHLTTFHRWYRCMLHVATLKRLGNLQVSVKK